MLGGTFAVSFLLSAESEAGAITGPPATDGDFGAEGGIDAEGITVPGGLGATGGAPDFGTPGGTPTTEGGFGPMGAIEGGFGAAGATPAIEGGLGATGGVDNPGAFGANEGIPGGFGSGEIPCGSPGEGGTAADSGVAAFGTGLGGRLIIAVSRGFDARGWPSRRGGRTMRTVSFLGSDIGH
ncbi:MAG TPA: hypothetical protein VIS96_07390 [Terrimicrobiaceae bacterium]